MSTNPSPSTELAPTTNTPTRTELPASSDPRTWNAQQTALMEFAGLARTVQRDGRDVVQVLDRGVAQAFLRVCESTGLDPFARQIYAMEIGGRLSIVTGVDGFRVIAQRSRGYRGQVGPQWATGARLADGSLEWVDAWLPEVYGLEKNARPLAARIGILREGFAEPLWQVVTWAEFGKDNGQWRTIPAHMLGIRAETHGLRRTFPNDLSGLYTPEDFDDDVVVQSAAGVDVERDNIAAVATFTDVDELRVFYTERQQAGQMTDALHAAVMGRAGFLRAAQESPAPGAERPAGEAEPVPAPEHAPEPENGPENGAHGEPERDPAEPTPDEWAAIEARAAEQDGDR